MKMFAISKERKFVMWVCGLVACVLAFIFEVAGCATVAWKVVRKQWLYGAYKFVEYDIVIRTGLWRGTYCVNTKCHMWEFGEPELGECELNKEESLVGNGCPNNKTLSMDSEQMLCAEESTVRPKQLMPISRSPLLTCTC